MIDRQSCCNKFIIAINDNHPESIVHLSYLLWLCKSCLEIISSTYFGNHSYVHTKLLVNLVITEIYNLLNNHFTLKMQHIDIDYFRESNIAIYLLNTEPRVAVAIRFKAVILFSLIHSNIFSYRLLRVVQSELPLLLQPPLPNLHPSLLTSSPKSKYW